MIRIRKARLNFEREPFATPLGFKGGYLTEAWQAVVRLEGDNGCSGLGVGTQSVLWSDVAVFASHSEPGGNSLMLLITEHALNCAVDRTFETPLDLLDQLLPVCLAYGRALTGRRDLRPTFALNALVAVDNAAWQLYAASHRLRTFDELVPATTRPALTTRHSRVGMIPLFSYKVGLEDIVKAVAQGVILAKIKIGADPEADGDQEKMLAWDKQRLSDIHTRLKDCATPHSASGRIPYYLDANGRYDSKDRLCRLLDHAAAIGALERILMIEEPFPEEYRETVSDLPVALAADESLHTVEEARERLALGYRMLTLKPIAKTLSMTLRVLEVAHAAKVPCFCADLTVNPVLVDWNKNVAARLAPLPGLNVPLFETNGAQYYRNWRTMQSHLPDPAAAWTEPRDGFFSLPHAFYQNAGGILTPSPHYAGLVH